MEKRSRLLILITPPALWLMVLYLIPLGMMVVFSFRAGTFGAAREAFTLEHYRNFLSHATYQRLLWQSGLLALQCALLAVLLAYPLAYFLAFKAGRLRIVFLTLLILPAWTSYLLRLLSWKLILGSNGVVNSLLISSGLVEQGVPFFLYSRTAVLITLIYEWLPFAALPIFSALERIDPRLLEAAADLGCKPWQAFLRVTLPLSLTGVAASFFFVFIPTLGEWVAPSMVGGVNGMMYGNLIQDQFLRALNWSMGAVLALALLAAVLVFTFMLSRFVRISDASVL